VALGIAAAAAGDFVRAESLIAGACRAFEISPWAGNRTTECRARLAAIRTARRSRASPSSP
jgi:hypothetical protein